MATVERQEVNIDIASHVEQRVEIGSYWGAFL